MVNPILNPASSAVQTRNHRWFCVATLVAVNRGQANERAVDRDFRATNANQARNDPWPKLTKLTLSRGSAAPVTFGFISVKCLEYMHNNARIRAMRG